MIVGVMLGMFSNLSAVSQQEKEALIALYDSTNGDSWYKSYHWKSAGDPCDDKWYGVYCTGEHISQLFLEHNNLVGDIPVEIKNLTFLYYLKLDANKLTNITELGSLKNLEILKLGFCQFTDIPAEIGNMTNLKYLSLTYNQLKSIPAAIGNLANLQTLDLRYNRLESLPAAIGNLANLQTLSLDENHLTAIPPGVLNLTNLVGLYVYHNRLTGEIPAGVWHLTNLKLIDLSGNRLSGEISREIINLINLTSLRLAYNCNLYSNDTDVQAFIDNIPFGDTYQKILDTNTHNCNSRQPALVPVMIYLLN